MQVKQVPIFTTRVPQSHTLSVRGSDYKGFNGCLMELTISPKAEIELDRSGLSSESGRHLAIPDC
jgi:hypothetical protein